MAKRFRSGEKDRQIGRDLANLRNQAGLSQEEVSSAFEISSQQLSKYERGQNKISHSLWGDIVDFLETRIRTARGFHENQAPYISHSDKSEEIESILQMADSLRDQIGELANKMRMVLAKSN